MPDASLPAQPAPPLRVEATRGSLVESVHPVSVAVTTPEGELAAWAGDPHRVTYWRSAAKPFQALPMVQDGAADAFGLGDEELALACASHSSEPQHLRVAAEFLRKIGCSEADLACGPHPPIGPDLGGPAPRRDGSPTPLWSNCSGKHSGMLALARHHGWPTTGYNAAGHPAQQRILEELARWSGVPPESIVQAVDGCTAVCFALPLSAMATAYARFATSPDPAAVRLRSAMMGHPGLVGGEARFCSELMAAWPGEVVAKIGAEGVYSAALPRYRLGVALKVEDGDSRCAPVALYGVLQQLLQRFAPELTDRSPLDKVAQYAAPATRNTRGTVTGGLRLAGALHFGAPSGANSGVEDTPAEVR